MRQRKVGCVMDHDGKRIKVRKTFFKKNICLFFIKILTLVNSCGALDHGWAAGPRSSGTPPRKPPCLDI